jgi:hypothetical protein
VMGNFAHETRQAMTGHDLLWAASQQLSAIDRYFPVASGYSVISRQLQQKLMFGKNL